MAFYPSVHLGPEGAFSFWEGGAAPVYKMADAHVCIHCSQPFERRKKRIKRLDRHNLSGKLRRHNITVYDALKQVYLYEVSTLIY